MTPRQLYQWAKEDISAINFQYCTSEEHDSEEKLLHLRFSQAHPIPGTQKLHSFVPLSKSKVLTKLQAYSSDTQSKEEIVTRLGNELDFSDIKGFVTCVYENEWWPACVLETDSENMLVKLSFLQPCGPHASFTYPATPDVLTLEVSSILTLVDPRTATGRAYTLSAKESQDASSKLESWKAMAS